ncbi:MAG: methyl-accepting chemotaxis protein [Bacillota bacterium]
MSLRLKIMMGFLVIVSVFFISSGIVYYNVHEAELVSKEIPHEVKRDNQLNQVRYCVAMQISAMNGYLYYKQDGFVDQYKKYYEESSKTIQNMIDTARVDSNRQKYIQMKNLQEKLNGMFLQKVVPLVKEGKAAEAGEIARNESTVLSGSLNALVVQLVGERSQKLDSLVEGIASDVMRASWVSLAGSVLALLVGCGIGFLMIRLVVLPVRRVAEEATKIAAGDLTGGELEVKTRDEVGQLASAFNAMRSNLKEIAGLLQEKSNVVALSSAQLSASAENVSAGATSTATTVTEVAGTVEQVSANARQIAETSAKAAGLAGEGSMGIERLGDQMQIIRSATATSSKVIYGLNESTARISQIVDMITQIAEQTNLLALNAAIEAARAGEQGRGFAVVAEEVRKLAEQSASAAKDIYKLIGSIQQESVKAVHSMEEGSGLVEAGSLVVNEVGGVFSRIISSVQGLAKEIEYVADATGEISSAVENVAAASQQQTATMEEVSSTTQTLALLAHDLEEISRRFKLS